MNPATFVDHRSGNASCNGVVTRDNYNLPGHGKASPALLPSPPPSRSTTATSLGKSTNLPHTCAHCNRQFRRLCDLNKHAYSHIRPFKCAVPTCKYYTLGWPTRKELERHVNDKHAPTPKTYACLFQPCPYRSKRQSNCNQHMEKTHEWTYVRSKTSSARPPSRMKMESHTATPKGVTGSIPVVSTLNPPEFPKFHNIRRDFLLFPDDADHSIAIGQDRDESHEPLDLEDRDRRDSQVFIPWTSPITRFRANATLLRRFSQAYEPSDKSAEDESPLVDGETLTVEDDTSEEIHRSRKSDNIRTRAGGASPTPQGQAVASSSSSNPSGLGVAARQCISLHQKPLKQDDGDRDDEDRPSKRLKPSTNIDFKDTEMSDIFHSAHPQIYNRDNKALFGSCHSTHKDISTLVRHLSRPPHKLEVHARYVSSFEVRDEEHSHAKVGLCRRCWLCFHDREAFNRHISVLCEKISKGKSEKWKILFDSFTPFDGPETSRQPDESGRPLTLSRDSPPRPLVVPNQGHEVAQPSGNLDPTSLRTSPLPPTTVDIGQPVSCQHLDGSGCVPMDEYRRLHADVQAIKRILAAIVLQRGHRGVMASSLQATTPGGNPFPPQQSSWPFDGQRGTTADTPGEITNAAIGNLLGTLDRESLVGHMDSQSTDVDPQGLMEEVERTLTRANSGVGSVRSALRHVPNSPPTRSREDTDVAATRSDGPSGSHAQPQLPRHQSTSIPDSGYASDKKRGSIGEVGLTEHLKKLSSHQLLGPQPPEFCNNSIDMPEVHEPPQQGRRDGADQTATTTGPDPSMLMPWMSETGISPSRWDLDQTYTDDFAHGAFPPSCGPGNEDSHFLDAFGGLDSQGFTSED